MDRVRRARVGGIEAPEDGEDGQRHDPRVLDSVELDAAGQRAGLPPLGEALLLAVGLWTRRGSSQHTRPLSLQLGRAGPRSV